MSREQLLGVGVTRRQIDRALTHGRVRQLHRGVYLLGPKPPKFAREVAAVLACAPRAALSHRSAAHIWGLLPYPARSAFVDVTVADRNPGRYPGLRIHRSASLLKTEVTIKHGISITNPTRTLLDLASEAEPDELEQAVAEAFALRRTSRSKLLAMLERHPRRRGSRALGSLLDADRDPARTRSWAERRLLALLRRGALPPPEVNASFAGWEVDFLWRERRLAVEVDGYAAHSSPRAFERDRIKALDLQRAGLTLIRPSAKQLRDRPDEVLSLLARLLGDR